MMKNFHIVRLSTNLQDKWKSCLAGVGVRVSLSLQALQVVLKRMFNMIVKMLTTSESANVARIPDTLTKMEENVLRYMPEYIIMKLKSTSMLLT